MLVYSIIKNDKKSQDVKDKIFCKKKLKQKYILVSKVTFCVYLNGTIAISNNLNIQSIYYLNKKQFLIHKIK